MRILCVSDQVDPLVYSPSIKERFSDVGLVLGAGDLPMEYLDYIVSCLNVPLLFVFGNHNLTELPYYRPASGARFPVPTTDSMDHAFGATHIGFKARREAGILFAGLDGSMMYNGGLNQYTEFAMYAKIAALTPRLLFNRIFYGRWLDILVTHAPPRGIHDKTDCCHVGFKSFLWFMRAFKPRFLVHGHIHLYDLNDVRVSAYRSTTVVNAFNHFILDTGDGQ
jgi:uncharacterized protein